MSKLFKPIDYLKIQHPQKLKYDLYIPAFVAILGTLLLIILPQPVKFFGENGLVIVITNILQMLTGFYIASLAAVATFQKEDLDKPMPGRPLEITVAIQGVKKEEALTRRRFLCLLFGYLALLSFFLYFIGAGANLLVPNAKYIIPIKLHHIARWIFAIIYLFLTANLMITTLHGLYYMVERIHRSDPVLIKKDRGDNVGDAGH